MNNTREKLIELIIDEAEELYLSEIETIADHLIANGVTIQKWIPMTERLPEVWMDIDKEGIMEPMEFIVFIKGAVLPTVKFFNGENFCDDWGNIYTVTHWMPLPEPPKGE